MLFFGPLVTKFACEVGDCEVGSAKKACKNCTCGRAEEEEKVKLGLTMDQLKNPQSACGSVCYIFMHIYKDVIVFVHAKLFVST